MPVGAADQNDAAFDEAVDEVGFLAFAKQIAVIAETLKPGDLGDARQGRLRQPAKTERPSSETAPEGGQVRKSFVDSIKA